VVSGIGDIVKLKMKKYRVVIVRFFMILLALLPQGAFVLFPASTNYTMKDYEFGSGGGFGGSSNYLLEGVAGEQTGPQESTNYKTNAGLAYAQTANVPAAPTWVNSSSWYNKLHLTINQANNPSDSVYAVAISDDDFVTTSYVQNDNTVGSTLGNEDYQSYANWGSGSGEDVIGLSQNTTYKVKVKARQGLYSESAWGPTVSVATSPLSLSFDIDVSTSDSETGAPYNLSIGTLGIGSVTTASEKIWVDLETNAVGGGFVYVAGTSNVGLRSANVNYTIPSSSTDLSGASEGYGVKAATVTNVTASSPYNGASENVGVVDATVRELLNSGNAPVTSGRASFELKVKTSTTTPSASDYTDTLTLVASGSF